MTRPRKSRRSSDYRGLSQTALHRLQQDTFEYFLKEFNPSNGHIPDNTREGAPVSIAVVGLALAAYPVGVQRRFLSRAEAIKRTLTTLRDFWNSPQGEQPDVPRYADRASNMELRAIDH